MFSKKWLSFQANSPFRESSSCFIQEKKTNKNLLLGSRSDFLWILHVVIDFLESRLTVKHTCTSN